ncbi:FtsB family cell division protein [Nocardiopsis coralliicola]
MPEEPDERSRPRRTRSPRGGAGGARSAAGGSARGAAPGGPRAGRSAAGGAKSAGGTSADSAAGARKGSGAKAPGTKQQPGGSAGAKSAGAKKAAKGAKTGPAAARSTGTGPKAKQGGSGAAAAAAGAGRVLKPALTSRAAILALVVCAIALSLAYPLREYIAQRSEIARLQDELAQRQDSVDTLTERREELGDADYIEREARTRLHYQYPGERAYVVVDGDEEQHAEEAADAPEDPWYTLLWKSVQAADDPDAAGRGGAGGQDAPER